MDKNKETTKATAKTKKKNRLVTFFKEAFSELKKVSWPTFTSVVKTTLMVLAVVAVFLVVLLAFDLILELGHGSLMAPLEEAVRRLL